MDISEALREDVAAANWTPTKLAAEGGVTESAAKKWLRGESVPRGPSLEMLRVRLPGFAENLNRRAQAHYHAA